MAHTMYELRIIPSSPAKLVEDTQILDMYGYVLYKHSCSKSCQKDQNVPPVSLL